MDWIQNAYLPSAIEIEAVSVAMQQKEAKYTNLLAELSLVTQTVPRSFFSNSRNFIFQTYLLIYLFT